MKRRVLIGMKFIWRMIRAGRRALPVVDNRTGWHVARHDEIAKGAGGACGHQRRRRSHRRSHSIRHHGRDAMLAERWCPGREAYATTNTMARCLLSIWWCERLAWWRRFATSRNSQSRQLCLIIGWQPSLLGSIFAACRKLRLFDPWLASNPREDLPRPTHAHGSDLISAY
jgi:hypothetical protein